MPLFTSTRLTYDPNRAFLKPTLYSNKMFLVLTGFAPEKKSVGLFSNVNTRKGPITKPDLSNLLLQPEVRWASDRWERSTERRKTATILLRWGCHWTLETLSSTWLSQRSKAPHRSLSAYIVPLNTKNQWLCQSSSRDSAGISGFWWGARWLDWWNWPPICSWPVSYLKSAVLKQVQPTSLTEISR